MEISDFIEYEANNNDNRNLYYGDRLIHEHEYDVKKLFLITICVRVKYKNLKFEQIVTEIKNISFELQKPENEKKNK